MPTSRSMAARGQSLFAIAQKVTKNACPCTPLHPAVLATGGMRQRHTKASLSLRKVCADDASTTARYSAPRRGLKGRFEPMFDRFAMRTTRAWMRASGLRCHLIADVMPLFLGQGIQEHIDLFKSTVGISPFNVFANPQHFR